MLVPCPGATYYGLVALLVRRRRPTATESPPRPGRPTLQSQQCWCSSAANHSGGGRVNLHRPLSCHGGGGPVAVGARARTHAAPETGTHLFRQIGRANMPFLSHKGIAEFFRQPGARTRTCLLDARGDRARCRRTRTCLPPSRPAGAPPPVQFDPPTADTYVRAAWCVGGRGGACCRSWRPSPSVPPTPPLKRARIYIWAGHSPPKATQTQTNQHDS